MVKEEPAASLITGEQKPEGRLEVGIADLEGDTKRP